MINKDIKFIDVVAGGHWKEVLEVERRIRRLSPKQRKIDGYLNKRLKKQDSENYGERVYEKRIRPDKTDPRFEIRTERPGSISDPTFKICSPESESEKSELTRTEPYLTQTEATRNAT